MDYMENRDIKVKIIDDYIFVKVGNKPWDILLHRDIENIETFSSATCVLL